MTKIGDPVGIVPIFCRGSAATNIPFYNIKRGKQLFGMAVRNPKCSFVVAFYSSASRTLRHLGSLALFPRWAKQRHMASRTLSYTALECTEQGHTASRILSHMVFESLLSNALLEIYLTQLPRVYLDLYAMQLLAGVMV